MPVTQCVKEGHGSPRFPIEASVSYKVLVGRNLGQAGKGRTIRISSKVVTFEPDREIPLGFRATNSHSAAGASAAPLYERARPPPS